jgi:hypothetical protein
MMRWTFPTHPEEGEQRFFYGLRLKSEPKTHVLEQVLNSVLIVSR